MANSAYAETASSRAAVQDWPHLVHAHSAPARSESGVTVSSGVWHSGHVGVSTEAWARGRGVIASSRR